MFNSSGKSHSFKLSLNRTLNCASVWTQSSGCLFIERYTIALTTLQPIKYFIRQRKVKETECDFMLVVFKWEFKMLIWSADMSKMVFQS